MKKVNLKSLGLFWAYLAKHPRYAPYVEQADLSVFADRAQHEGLSFLTVVLPLLGKAIDRFHSTQEWSPPSEFALDADLNPKFLGKAIKAARKGDSVAVDCVRQLSYVFYKLEVDYDDALVESFLSQFRNTDRDLDSWESVLSPIPLNCDTTPETALLVVAPEGRLLADHLDLMGRIIGNVLRKADPLDIRPTHGSGATACRTKNWDKWHCLRYYPKLDQVFPYADFFFYNFSHLVDELEKLEEASESVAMARVVLVPKDSRGPRVISCEPAELMYIQQGLMRKLYQTLETHYLTNGRINFTDQSVNKELARLGSLNDDPITGYATLDMKDASDRVSLKLVQRVFPERWVEALEACRSEFTMLPDKTVIKLNKFAPMGSACCFPVEALVFWASAMATQIRVHEQSKELGDRKRHKDVGDYFKHLRDVYVYGDDIILAPELAAEVIGDLEKIGLLVNRTKSFTKGPFRESCGGDYHHGYDVTPIRYRKELSKSCTGIAAGSDLINSLVTKFGSLDTDFIIELVKHIEFEVGYHYPVTPLGIPCTIFATPENSAKWVKTYFSDDFKRVVSVYTDPKNDYLFAKRFNKELQRYEYRILQLSTRQLRRREPTWCELLRKELTGGLSSNATGEVPAWIKVQEKADPGMYAASHSARAKWAWVWLG
jgi:hypothetical protein